jgi:hypothetical protein
VASSLFIASAGCRDLSEREEFDEVLATMSLKKASDFLRSHPDSPYADQLVGHLIAWCEEDSSSECFGLLTETIPTAHPRYGEVATRHEDASAHREPDHGRNGDTARPDEIGRDS